MKKFALIVAGGSGNRMGSDIPKQFLELKGKPILMKSIECFKNYDNSIEIVLVLPSNQFETWRKLCDKYKFNTEYSIASGGESRFQSVKNGLAKLPETGLVFIHDGVRPLVSKTTLLNCEKMAVSRGNALPVVPVVESIRHISGESSKHVDRNSYCIVQTPQTFQLGIIKKAYSQPEETSFTDDASVCEAMGIKINLVEGNPENIKITYPSDLRIAEYHSNFLNQ